MSVVTIPMTRAQFEAKAAQLKAEQGLVITGDTGTLSKDGVTAKYTYDGVTLTAQIIDHPFVVSMSYCVNKLAAWLQPATT